MKKPVIATGLTLQKIDERLTLITRTWLVTLSSHFCALSYLA
jgi:hypothetical protein